jgi:imidazolonepropionase
MSQPSKPCIWTDARIATMAPDRTGLGVIEDGAIVSIDGRISWIGPSADVPAAFAAAERQDLAGRWVLPGLIDCHTHLVHGGHRAREFEMRLAGESYEAIARAGGGIVATVAARRERGGSGCIRAATA